MTKREQAAAIKRRIKACKKILHSRSRPKGKMETLCILRQIDDLENGHKRGLVWDEDEAVRVVDFVQMHKHWKGKWAGTRFILAPWQEQLWYAPLFGWRLKNGLRRFREAYGEVPRTNGKSMMAGTTADFCFIAEGESAPEVYSGATSTDQARIVFEISCESMVDCPEFTPYISIGKHAIVGLQNHGTYKPVSSDAGRLHGKHASCVIIDEYHEHPTDEVYAVLRTGMGVREQPLIVIITTAGWDTSSPCWQKREYARRVLEGIIKDDSRFVFIACADPKDDWRLVSTWKKANPNYGISVDPENLKIELKTAKAQPSYQNTFRRLYLNQWVQQENRWLDMEAWDKCGQDFTLDDFAGEPCWAGLDLSSTTDLTAWVLAFLREGTVYLYPTAWIPKERMIERERRDGVPYTQWVAEGHVKVTPGNVIDYAYIEKHITEDSKRFKLREVAYDPWNAGDLVQRLQDTHKLPMLEHRQGTGSMNTPSKEFERRMLEGTMAHPKNPCFTWNADCVAIRETSTGDIMPTKPQRAVNKRVDLIVAGIMALGRAVLEGGKPRDWSQIAERGLASTLDR